MHKPFPIISLPDLIRAKKPGLARFIPGFVYKWAEKIIHLKDINRVLQNNGHLKDAEFAEYVMKEEVKAELKIQGIENIPAAGGAILVSNHPLGGLEGLVLISVASKRRNDMKVIVNNILGEIPNFNDIFIPVNNLGKSAKGSLQKVEEAYASGELVIVFPAGLCSRKNNGIVRDLTWQRSFIGRAKKYNLPVIPVYFSGVNSNRFYNLANFRKKLGIKTNIEMFLLIDELYRQKGKKFEIIIGEPIPAERFNSQKSNQQWAIEVQNHVYSLAKNPLAIFNSVQQEKNTA